MVTNVICVPADFANSWNTEHSSLSVSASPLSHFLKRKGRLRYLHRAQGEEGAVGATLLALLPAAKLPLTAATGPRRRPERGGNRSAGQGAPGALVEGGPARSARPHLPALRRLHQAPRGPNVGNENPGKGAAYREACPLVPSQPGEVSQLPGVGGTHLRAGSPGSARRGRGSRARPPREGPGRRERGEAALTSRYSAGFTWPRV